MTIEFEEYFAISRQLEDHHALFYKMWEMGRPIFSNDVPTAEVRFSEHGKFIEFHFNPTLWESLTEYERKFVICHECLHVILNHGIRIKDTDDQQRSNISLDVVVNHALVNQFGFDRNQIRQEKNLCWVDTVFPDQQVFEDENFEYYYNLMNEKSQVKDLVDSHDGLVASEEEDAKRFIDAVGNSLTNEEKESLRELMETHFESDDDPDADSDNEASGVGGVGRGDIAGCGWKVVKVRAIKKHKWETVIKKWSKRYLDHHDVEQWARINRRFTVLPNDLMIPSEMEQEVNIDGKIEVWFFQDTSGSCLHLAERFFKAAKSLDPQKFDIRMFCFDTKVYETSLASGELYGFGGTSFNILETHIQKEIKKNKEKYPEAVFVITDGDGNHVQPQYPKRWHWFLSQNRQRFIPDACNIYDLSKFE